MHFSNSNKRRSWKRIRSSRPFSKISNEKKMSRTKRLVSSWKCNSYNERETKNQIKLKWPKLSTPTWGYMVATQMNRSRNLYKRITTTPIVRKTIHWALHRQERRISMSYVSGLKQRMKTIWFPITWDLRKLMRIREPSNTSGRCEIRWQTTGQCMIARLHSMTKIDFWLWFWGSSTGTTTSLHLHSPKRSKSHINPLGNHPRTITILLLQMAWPRAKQNSKDRRPSSGRTWTGRPKIGTTTSDRRTQEAIDFIGLR